MAAYNSAANHRLYATCSLLDDTARRKDRGAFFRSIHGTLNHLLSMDQLWFGRVEPPAFMPVSHDQILHESFADLRAARRRMDQRIEAICSVLDDDRLTGPLSWISMEGEELTAPLRQVLTHAFNHQTHHRGQIHAMFTRLGRAEPSLDYHHTMFRQP
jgi:uncharacterized damage-inducible protein DinB